MIDRMNVRVYAACLHDGKLLVLHEEYAGSYLTKLPGGGLEFGEGTIECLKREFEEELNLKIRSTMHFYTQEDFLVSRFRENEQLLTVYYLAEIEDINDLLIVDPCIEKAEWIPLTAPNPFELPIDKIVYEKLQERFLEK
ncbi:NUDIX domain-containing protein [Daejeonia sp. YH14]|uniref:NUDIX domain-containing protein n=1 Tax=Daejeonia sp. YH14 TaxID=3439042 RepID=UPI003F493570